MTRTISVLLGVSIALGCCPLVRADLEVTGLGDVFAPDPKRVVVSQGKADPGGSTSVRNQEVGSLEWKKEGYFERNRDLGQVFTAEKDFRLGALVLRTGPSADAVLGGATGARVFLQFFEVSGTPRINDNGTPPGTRAKHGFSTNHRCDDFLEGVTYRSIRIVKGGLFPKLPSASDGDKKGRLHYLRWQLTGEDRLRLEAGKRYAFLVGFDEPGKDRAFTLANHNAAGSKALPSLTDGHDAYHGGWAIRREAGSRPPTTVPGPKAPADRTVSDRLRQESLLPADRDAGSPGTDGYPDVDTYRDLQFYLERAD